MTMLEKVARSNLLLIVIAAGLAYAGTAILLPHEKWFAPPLFLLFGFVQGAAFVGYIVARSRRPK